jgi:hypothetical protein
VHRVRKLGVQDRDGGSTEQDARGLQPHDAHPSPGLMSSSATSGMLERFRIVELCRDWALVLRWSEMERADFGSLAAVLAAIRDGISLDGKAPIGGSVSFRALASEPG